MSQVEASIGRKEPGVRSPGIREIKIGELNPVQLATLMHWDFTEIKSNHPSNPIKWHFIFSSENEDPQKRKAFSLLITPSLRRVELTLISQRQVQALLKLEHIDTIDLINYRDKMVFFRSELLGGFLSISKSGCFTGRGLKVLG